MMTPDSRPIGVLTPTILATASHWCLHGNGIADTRPSSLLVLRPSEFDGDLPLLTCEGDCYWNDDSGWMCYPCTLQPNGLIVPEPWPVMDGEEEIEEWRGMSCKFDAQITSEWGHTYWALFTHMNDETSYETELRPGMHPAPRKGGKWVWEKDR